MDRLNTELYNYCSGITNICVQPLIAVIAMVMLSTTLLVEVIVVIPVSPWVVFMVVSQSVLYCQKIKCTLMENITHLSTVWNI